MESKYIFKIQSNIDVIDNLKKSLKTKEIEIKDGNVENVIDFQFDLADCASIVTILSGAIVITDFAICVYKELRKNGKIKLKFNRPLVLLSFIQKKILMLMKFAKN